LHAPQHAVVDVLQRQVEVRDDLASGGEGVDQLVGEVDRVGVEDADPLDTVDAVQFAQQFRETNTTVQIEAIVGRVLGDDDQLADAVLGQLAGLADDLLDRLGDVLAAHAGDGTEGAEPVATFGDLQIRIVARCDAQPSGILEGADRRGTEQGALFAAIGERAGDDGTDLLAAEDPDEVIDAGHFLQQRLALALGKAAGDDNGADAALLLEREHLADDGKGLLPRRLDEAAGVDDDHIGAVGVGGQRVAILGQLAEHALGVNEVLGATQTDERVAALGGTAHARRRPSRRGLPGDDTHTAAPFREPSALEFTLLFYFTVIADAARTRQVEAPA